MSRINVVVVAAAALGVALVGFLAWKMHRKRKQTFKKVGVVSQLFIHPIKSCRGISVTSAECTPLGLKNGVMRDRVFLLITPDGSFVTARQVHKLVTVVPSFEGDEVLLVDAPEMPTLRIPLNEEEEGSPSDIGRTPKYITCKIWGHPVDGCDCGDEAAEWFQRFLEKPDYRLVHFRSNLKPKILRERKRFGDLFNEDDVSAYADLSAYMMMTESTVDDLNTRLDSPVGSRNFRPNIVLRDSVPYAEDTWKMIRTEGGVQFRNVKPCQRCILTTVDPETGVKTGEDPLKTLRTYRTAKDPYWKQILRESPLLGINLCIDEVGTIAVGDAVYAHS